ncbi:exocyst complex component 1-like isoform X1 [Physella acuta]|uniref:exocyst complex component 1-like isoform X1 n=1 Tax=Physella acuta TaxID=109671 RepID=UPI0027DCB6D0|nr:exocyst complex component 1-like isoform X1 [Physella acuta]XP_059178952.1 exocyst complex component 1-like isoform X1 [Physella acuta]XP_059178953.1 exocyst complex component 1-like isoform X1 [Physella acuta]XP_059178955.1 exocyst complex component 1-like isoform X1 [Physella acuta]
MSRQQLQQMLFSPNDERLITMISVAKMPRKTNLKKRSSLLCAVLNTMESPAKVYIYHVKKADRADGFKKKMSWLLRDLKQFDGKSADKQTTDFDLHFFDKTIKWSASSVEEKETFISSLWRLSNRFLLQRPEFVNIPDRLLEDIKDPHTLREKSQSVDDISIEGEDYQALSTKEEADLELLMSECQVAISNAEVFTEQLSKQLSVLDGANIHSIMGSEDQVLNLMRLLDDGIKEAEQIEEKLDSYDKMLANVKEQMEVMRDKDLLMTVRNNNHQRLLDDLQNLVNQLDLDLKHVQALMDVDLTTPNGITECTAAAQALHRCMNADIHPSLLRMGAVEEQQKRFKKMSVNFSKKLVQHLNNLFIQQKSQHLFGNEVGETLSKFTVEIRMPNHSTIHRELVIYADLMLWLKNSDESVFQKLSAVYMNSLCKLYSREISEFLESAKQRLGGNKDGKGKHATLSRLSGSTTSLAKIDHRGRSGSVQSIESSAQKSNSEVDLTAKGLFDQVLERVLHELERVCIAEQDFCFKFFHLIDKNVSMEEPHGKDKDSSVGAGDVDADVWVVRQTNSSSEGDYVTENLGGGLLQKRATVTSEMRQINDQVRVMMGELFPQLESELDNFLTHADRQDGMYSMYMLVRMSQHVINSQDMGSYLGKTYGNCLIKVKRNFDKFIESMMANIKETKVSKKSRCGIISFVHNFEEFTNLAENIFKGSDRHADLDKAYTKVVRIIFEQIVRVAQEHQKTPKEVVLMENFHRMFSILSHLKNPCLENDRKEAKQRYTENLQAYTVNLLGRPLEKLHIFFEGVESKISTGVKPEEVGYQLAFNKQELRKVIKEYPGKEVKKTLEHLNKKVEKQLCEEENLIQVVWHEMQDLFITQYKYYDNLMKQCYPDSNITLDFTIDNVLQFFSDIAQSH